ncbi:MAG: GNAT family N-acetyltransferase [Cyclobacteriaceae bacterium]|nr:GNAT family N-acetyltransferase [Cyclobacteriaceae bacterium]
MEHPHRKLVLHENNLDIWKYHGIPETGIAFFESTNWGSAGMVYERKNSNELIRLLKDPYLYAIEQGNIIVGTAVFCHTRPHVGNQPYNCHIIRYFAASAAIQGKKIMKHYAGKVMEVVQEAETEKTIYVGCVEKGNLRSYRVVENAGYEKLGLLCVNAFSRFYPKAQPNMERLKPEEYAAMLDLIRKQYRQHALLHTDYLFLKGNYFVLREQGEIVAGCQYHRVHWAINKMPGLMGKIIMNVLPYLPLISKLFNPKRFEFLAFEGMFFKPGYEKSLLQLFEGLLHHEKVNSALFWMGENCPYRKLILDYGKLGLLNSFVNDSGVYIMTSYQNISEEEIKKLKSLPLYASAFDYI